MYQKNNWSLQIVSLVQHQSQHDTSLGSNFTILKGKKKEILKTNSQNKWSLTPLRLDCSSRQESVIGGMPPKPISLKLVEFTPTSSYSLSQWLRLLGHPDLDNCTTIYKTSKCFILSNANSYFVTWKSFRMLLLF